VWKVLKPPEFPPALSKNLFKVSLKVGVTEEIKGRSHGTEGGPPSGGMGENPSWSSRASLSARPLGVFMVGMVSLESLWKQEDIQGGENHENRDA